MQFPIHHKLLTTNVTAWFLGLRAAEEQPLEQLTTSRVDKSISYTTKLVDPVRTLSEMFCSFMV